MDYNVKTKKSLGWGWIIFLIIIFWPVGLVLAIRKLATDKKALMSGKTTALSVVGWCLAVVGGLGFLGSLSNFSISNVILPILFLVGGIALIDKAKKAKKQAAKYRKYIDVVVNCGEKSIDNIVGAVGLQYDVVVKDLQDMIDMGYLNNAYINQVNREIILKQAVQPQMYQQVQNPVQAKAVRCPGCGANNVVSTSGVCECEYCGTPLTA